MAVERGAGAHRFALAAAEMAANTRCEDVVVLDLRGRSPVTEYFVIATGTSPRQMRTVVDEVRDLGKKTGFTAWRQDGYESARWIVLDCVNVVVHVFDTDSRDFYDLELLWGDSPRLDWRKELGLPPEVIMPARVADDDNEDDDGYDEEEESPVVLEIPDESTGSNSVEFVEVESPEKRGRKGRGAFPTVVEEEEDTTAEERSMGPLGEVADAVAGLDEDAEELAMQPTKKGSKKVGAKKGGKVVGRAAAKKPAKKAVKGGAKKPAAKKSAAKKSTKKAGAKSGGAKSSAKPAKKIKRAK